MSTSQFDLRGRIAIVTGASRGLGENLACALGRAGADLAVTSRTKASLNGRVKEMESIGRRILPVELDVRKLDSITKMVDTVFEQYGRIDILINNAGCNIRKPAVEMSGDDWDMVLETNLRGPFFNAAAVARTRSKRQLPGTGLVQN